MRFFLIFSTLLGITICFAQETVTPETTEKTKKERILNMMKIMQANHTKVNQLFAELPLEDINKNSTLQTSIQTLKEATRTLDSLRIPDEQFNKNVTLLNRKLDGFLSDLRDGKPYPISIVHGFIHVGNNLRQVVVVFRYFLTLFPQYRITVSYYW